MLDLGLGTVWAALLGTVCLLVVVHMLRSPRPHGGNRRVKIRPRINQILVHPELASYDLKTYQIPPSTGRVFQFFIWLLYTRLGKTVLLPLVKSNSNLDKLRNEYLPESPTFDTPHNPEVKDYSGENQCILQKLVDQKRLDSNIFQFNSVGDYVQCFREGVYTPTDVAEVVLRCTELSNKANPPLRGIVDYDRSVVLAMANASTERWKSSKPLSLLDGVPVAIKGDQRLEPYPLHMGAEFIPEVTKGICEGGTVQRLKSAGAVIIGVAHMPEFGCNSHGSNPNKSHLTCRNPYNPHHYAGGSSSGSAVCVAAGLCPIAIGADGGGSLRVPTALCGVVCLKTTNNLLEDSGSPQIAISTQSLGPISGSVLDSAITIDILSQEEDQKKKVSLQGLGQGRLDGLRLGIYWKYFEHAADEVVGKCKVAVQKLQALGATVEEIVIPELEESRIAHSVTILPELGTCLLAEVERHFGELNLETRLLLSTSYSFNAIEYINAQKQRTRAIEILKHIFKKVDIIATPGTGCVAPRIPSEALSQGICDAETTGTLLRYTFLAGFTGNPCLTLPVGYSSAGLPISLQLMGRWYEEHTLLQAGWALENCGGFPRNKPQVHYDILDQVRQK